MLDALTKHLFTCQGFITLELLDASPTLNLLKSSSSTTHIMASTKPSSNESGSEKQRPRIALDAVRRMVLHGIGHRIRDKQVQVEPTEEPKLSLTKESEVSSIAKLETSPTRKVQMSPAGMPEISPSKEWTEARSMNEKDMIPSLQNRWRSIEEEKAAIRDWNGEYRWLCCGCSWLMLD